MVKSIRIYLFAAGLLLAGGSVLAQPGTTAKSATAPSSVSQPAPPISPDEVGTRATPLPQAQVTAPVKPVENTEEEEENAQFKYSSLVRGVAAKLGVSKEVVYWGFNVINFAILAALAVWIIRKAMPHGFAPRTAEIQKGIEDARKASAEASARLSEIETRLGRLDTEIAELRGAAEKDFSAEEERIKADAERDAQHVIEAAEQEIAAAARSAHRELKAFAASLAVDLAEKKIKVDEGTDQALIRNFASQLGKDGQR